MGKYPEGERTSLFPSFVVLVWMMFWGIKIVWSFQCLNTCSEIHTTVGSMCIPDSAVLYDWCPIKPCFRWIQKCQIYDRGPVKYSKIHFRDGNNWKVWPTRPITVVVWVLVRFILMITSIWVLVWFILMITSINFQLIHLCWWLYTENSLESLWQLHCQKEGGYLDIDVCSISHQCDWK